MSRVNKPLALMAVLGLAVTGAGLSHASGSSTPTREVRTIVEVQGPQLNFPVPGTSPKPTPSTEPTAEAAHAISAPALSFGSATVTSDSPTHSSDHTNPDSVTVMVNKQNPLTPLDYSPEDLVTVDLPAAHSNPRLREEAAEAAHNLFEAASAAGVDMRIDSAYRSYTDQIATHQRWVSRYGEPYASRISARPGFSEHQTGLALDVSGIDGVCSLRICFTETPAGQWLADNAHEYGWIIRYPEGSEETVGYAFEPWHIRYVGVTEAETILDSGGIVEDAWGFPPAPNH